MPKWWAIGDRRLNRTTLLSMDVRGSILVFIMVYKIFKKIIHLISLPNWNNLVKLYNIIDLASIHILAIHSSDTLNGERTRNVFTFTWTLLCLTITIMYCKYIRWHRHGQRFCAIWCVYVVCHDKASNARGFLILNNLFWALNGIIWVL